ncbi:hypothetical protein IWQ47_002573 [Aquimarina sp. EL_43]|uniref:hypothetical protein n=1 Tax=unclassified Aquimarina TaxID=2627091 RepID=UPI0018CAB477|nr:MULTISPECIES: hypothetical protein [unclassified Aquimarina]MBG6131103.1 hypothetical protein [Aquimarina sp. EL_35]MBG6151562.1 hypothetical protein [Aquimarina sp. EL_32]MBG6169493.1 hypothetical protein [Aquimarina sp. EL_43]
MKIVIKFFIGFVIFLVLGAIILGVIANEQDGARQHFRLFNTSEEQKSVTFEMIYEDGTPSDVWAINEIIDPGNTTNGKLLPGTYLVKIWDHEEVLENEFEFSFSLPNPEESNYNYYRFDIAMDKDFRVVNMAAAYEGSSLANTMSKAVGAHQDEILIVETYMGNRPFLIPESYTDRTFIDVYEDMPNRIKYGELIYRLEIVGINSKTANETIK